MQHTAAFNLALLAPLAPLGESNPDWRDIAGVVRRINPDDPMATPIPSIGRTDFYLIEAPPYHAVGGLPRSFGPVACDRAEVDGIDLNLAAPCPRPDCGAIRLPLDRPLRTAVHAEGLPRRVEIVLAFVGDGGLALRSPPMPYPARHL